ncbi:unnamed protein product [Blepharisma stoltei]|uniref:phenylalanine 4-monooxygenase n=1 Tax=Blepharisma stoltei TaxID=1481888 RepID=A0AAU9JA67_9CILI|nr:unnamed protein product [Blepharisma stoltei]
MSCYRLARFFSKLKSHHEPLEHLKSMILTVKNDGPGRLQDALEAFSAYNINITHIQSRPAEIIDFRKGYDFKLDFELSDDPKMKRILKHLDKLGFKTQIVKSKEVPWFPRSFEDLDHLDQSCLAAGADLDSDHPGFNDEIYRQRRTEIAKIAMGYKLSDAKVPVVHYTDQEIETWQTAYRALDPLHKQYACDEYNQAVEEFKKHCSFREDNIPQLQDINEYLIQKTGFRLKPITGLLSQRDFLNFLAFRVFASTQYIRHHSVPFYTPEPDIIHELIGHAPLFADPDFADFSQEIGLASLGVSDEEIKKLGTCYWYSIEFGIIKKANGEKKVYGAGCLSSVDEIKNAVSDKPEIRFFDPLKAAHVPFPITSLQPIYFWSNSFEEAKHAMENYVWTVPRDVSVSYDKFDHTIKVHQDITMKK